MTNLRSLAYASLLTAALAAPASAQTAKTETFTEYRGSVDHAGFVDTKLSPNLALAWQNTEDRYSGNTSSPIIADGLVIYGLGAHVYAVDTATGATKWTYPSDPKTTVGAFNCPPAYDKGTVFIGSDDGNLYALDSKTGNLNWKVPGAGNIHVSPVVQDGVVYYASGSQLNAVDTAFGKAIWSTPYSTEAPIVASPALNDGYIFVADASGRIYSMSQAMARDQWSNEATESPTLAGALVLDRNQIYVRSVQTIATLSSRSGDVKSQWSFGHQVSTPPTVGDDGTLLEGTVDSRIILMDTRGRAIWSTTLSDAPSCPPLMTRDLVVVATNSGTVTLLDRATGNKKWVYALSPTYKAGSPQSSNDPVGVAPVVANGTLYILSDDGTLSAFTPTAPDNSYPTITGTYPAQDSTIPGDNLPWQITVSDIGSGINPTSVALKVDGTVIPAEYDPSTNSVRVKLVPPTGINVVAVPTHLDTLPDGKHTASLTVADNRGNKFTKTWSFTVDKTAAEPASTAPVSTGASNTSQDNNAPAAAPDGSLENPFPPATTDTGLGTGGGAAAAGGASGASTPTSGGTATGSGASQGQVSGIAPVAPPAAAAPGSNLPPLQSGGGGGGKTPSDLPPPPPI